MKSISSASHWFYSSLLVILYVLITDVQARANARLSIVNADHLEIDRVPTLVSQMSEEEEAGGTPPRRNMNHGTRDDCPPSEIMLTSLVPDRDNLAGYTTEARPTLWVYLPYTLNVSNPDAENPLMRIGNSAKLEIDDENGERREYETVVTGELTEPGIIGVTLPDNVPELVIGTELSWTFSVYCGDRDLQGRPITVRGRITRVEPGTLPDEQIWYDRLTEVGTTLRDDPDHPDYQQRWAELMNWVEVDGIGEAPIQECCTLERLD